MILKSLRREINKIDRSIIRLLGTRMSVAKKIVNEKRKSGLPVISPGREKEVVEKWQELSLKYGLDSKFIGKLIRLIISESKKVQNEEFK